MVDLEKAVVGYVANATQYASRTRNSSERAFLTQGYMTWSMLLRLVNRVKSAELKPVVERLVREGAIEERKAAWGRVFQAGKGRRDS